MFATRYLEDLFGLPLRVPRALHQRPKASIVEIIDVAVDLAPRQVVSQRPVGRVEHDARVKRRHVLQRRLGAHVLEPVEDVARREMRDNAAIDFSANGQRR
jgi:hypothetical protein